MEHTTVLDTIEAQFRLYGIAALKPLAVSIGLTPDRLQDRLQTAEADELRRNAYGIEQAQQVVTSRLDVVKRLAKGLISTWRPPQPVIAFGPR